MHWLLRQPVPNCATWASASRDANQMVGTMSGGEKQCLAIARAIHFGAKVLILTSPTAALGVKQSANVLKLIATARARGISVIFITHNVNHAYPIADSFTLLNAVNRSAPI